jgi:branched-chain amino acid transport system substrate-binding protein
MIKIGILLPRSSYYQSIGIDLFEGLKLGFKYLERTDVKIITENIGFGVDKTQCYKSAEKLLLEEEVDFVFAYIGQQAAELIKPLFQATQKMLVVLDAGAHIPNEFPKCANIIFLSLHNSLSSWLTSRRAFQDGYEQAGMVTGYYDGGYLQTLCISSGFENASGNIVFNHATGHLKEDFSMTRLIEYMNLYPKSALLTLFSGDFAQWFFEEMKSKFKTSKKPIYMTTFGLEESVLEQSDYPNHQIKGVVAWSKHLDNKLNKTFVKKRLEQSKKANIFSLLGWESAQLASDLSELLEKHHGNISEVAKALSFYTFESPRGIMKFNFETNTFISPMYEVSVEDNNGFCFLKVENIINDAFEEYEKMILIKPELLRSSWHNSYTCI